MHFLMLNDMPHWFTHVVTLSRPSCSTARSCDFELLVPASCHLQTFRVTARLLINIRNRTGPRMEPSRTPKRNISPTRCLPIQHHSVFYLTVNFFFHLKMLPFTPGSSSLTKAQQSLFRYLIKGLFEVQKTTLNYPPPRPPRLRLSPGIPGDRLCSICCQ
jgi:hypothetical protein